MEASTIDAGRVRERERVRERDRENRTFLAYVCVICVPYYAALAYAVYAFLSFVY